MDRVALDAPGMVATETRAERGLGLAGVESCYLEFETRTLKSVGGSDVPE
jgi:hypothetical protein